MQKIRRTKKTAEMYYDTAELQKLKYVKVVYMGLDNKYHEISTEVKFVGEVLISLYFRYNEDFNINYPQEILLKFITSDAMYLATSVLQEIKKSDNAVYFSVLPPSKMVRQQNRKYCRVGLDRTCVLVASDENGHTTTYMAKTVNLSGCGILIGSLETMDSDKFVAADFSKYGCYNIILFLEQDIVLKLFARYVRHECVDGSHRYAFHFMNVKQKNTDKICKYVTEEQIRQLKEQSRYKSLTEL